MHSNYRTPLSCFSGVCRRDRHNLTSDVDCGINSDKDGTSPIFRIGGDATPDSGSGQPGERDEKSPGARKRQGFWKKTGNTYFRAFGTIIGSESLTAVFGMGTGVTFPIWSPEETRRAIKPARAWLVVVMRWHLHCSSYDLYCQQLSC